MEILLGIVGITIVLLIVYDIMYTTLGVNGAGKISSFISSKVWFLLLYLAGKNGESKTLKVAGQIIVASIILTWIGGLWLGQILIYNIETGNIINGKTGTVATFLESIYFTGYIISSLGNGEFIPHGSFWQVYTAIVSFTGFTFITMSLTYLVPVLSAVSSKRQIGQYIHQCGTTPLEILKNSGKDNFEELEEHLSKLNTMIMSHSQQHLAYPVLHYFHESNKYFSTILNLAALDEAISLLLYSEKKQDGLNPAKVQFFRKTLTNYLEIIRLSYSHGKQGEEPPIPEFTPEEKRNLPIIIDEEELRKEWGKQSERRSILHKIVVDDGWKWETIYSRD